MRTFIRDNSNNAQLSQYKTFVRRSGTSGDAIASNFDAIARFSSRTRTFKYAREHIRGFGIRALSNNKQFLDY